MTGVFTAGRRFVKVADSLRSTHVVHVGDTLTPLEVRLRRSDGSYPSIGGKTVKFRAIDRCGEVAIEESDASVVVASEGVVSYDFKAEDVAEPRTLFGYFVVIDDEGERETFPAESRALVIEVVRD